MNTRARLLFGALTISSLLAGAMTGCSAPAFVEADDPGAVTQGAHFLVDVDVRSGVGGGVGVPLREGVSVSLRDLDKGEVLGEGKPMEEILGWFRVEKEFDKAQGSPSELLLVVEAEGHASRFVRVPPMTSLDSPEPLIVRALLYPTEQFEVANLFRLGMVDQRVSVTLPPEDAATGHAYLFDPLLDAQGIPGALLDSRGRHIGTGVFAAVTLDDGTGRRVSEATEYTLLRMRIPRHLWPSLVAIEPGDIFIEPGDIFIEPGDIFIEPGDIFVPSNEIAISVAVYGFDPTSGAWSYSSVGQLQTSAGQPVMMSQLDSIRSGEFSEALFLSAQVGHFSYWGLAWPIKGDACLFGILKDAEGRPLAGKTVSARGVDRPISSPPVVTDSDGRFCLSVPPVGSGPEYRLRLSLQYLSVPPDESAPPSFMAYDLPEVTIAKSAENGTCGEGGCQELDLPPMPVWLLNEGRSPAICEESHCQDGEDAGHCEIKVFLEHDHYDVDLNPFPANARTSVTARLPTAGESVLGACETECKLFDDEPHAGVFTLWVPRGEEVELTGTIRIDNEDGFLVRSGTSSFVDDCPAGKIAFALPEGYLTLEAVIQHYHQGEMDGIAWYVRYAGDQGLPADFIEVRSKAGALKWAIAAEGFDRPLNLVDYGKPNTAMQLHPRDGSTPEPLAEGDVISVWASGYDGRLALSATGSLTVVTP